MTITPVRDTQGAITSFVAVKQDVTARKELEERLRQAQKMEAIGRLAGGIAHDLNNVLTIIKGHSEILLESPHDWMDVVGPLQTIRDAGDRASRLTAQLLAFSRRQVLRPKALNLNEVLSYLEVVFRRRLGENLDLVVKQGRDLGRVKVDPTQIEQVIMDLVWNARDAMPQGGRLIIETANAVFDEVSCKGHDGFVPGSYVMLSISDSGHGMSEDVRAKIFEPFFTTKERAKSAGLGLSTVYGIVKQSGGNVTVESEPGKGSTFRIYFPQVEEKPEALKPHAVEQPHRQGRGVVLLVEDEPAVRLLTRSILESSGYTVLESGDPAEALRRFGAISALPHRPD